MAREILDYVEREMRSPEGLFYSATDADSMTPSGHAEEGYHFTWTRDELAGALARDPRTDESWMQTLEAYHPLRPNFDGRIILHAPRSHAAVAEERGVDLRVLVERLDVLHAVLREARDVRPRPLRDDKILSAWNGLMVSAFAKGALVLGEERYYDVGAQAASALLETLRDEAGRLMRSARNGQVRHRAYLEDYAFLIAGLLDLHEVRGEERWVNAAVSLQEELDAHFLDEAGGYFMSASDAPALLTREKPMQDGAIPSGNSVAADNLLRLEQLTGEGAYRTRAEALFSAFGNPLRRYPRAAPRMLMALDRYSDVAREVVIVREGRWQAEALSDAFARVFLPNRVATIVGPEHRSALPFLRGKGAIDGEATAYVCERGRCEAPTSRASTLLEQLDVIRGYDAEGGTP